MSQAGWYQDPGAPSMVRWWDGQRWTNDVRPGGPGGPGPGGPGVGGPGPGGPGPGVGGSWVGGGPWVAVPDPAADLAAEAKAGRLASLALLAGAVAYTGEYVLNALLVGRLWRAVRDWLNLPVARDGTRPPLVLPHSIAVLNLVSPLFSLALLGVGVVFLLWFEKAATLAKRAGLPARRSVGWAIGGWFVPIVNWWFPYQSAVDFFPPGHPGRHKVKRWWALWLALSFAGLFVVAASFISTGAGLVASAVAAALAFAAAWAGRDVIDEVARVHAGLVGR